MELNIVENHGQPVAEVMGTGVVMATVQDGLDLMANADYQGNARCIVIDEERIAPAFFDLRTGIAGEILQKYANYRVKLAIVGDFKKYGSNALNAFIVECNRGGNIIFTDNRTEALERLVGPVR